jgi:ABC-type xylose transport system substrate-binding protein
MMSLIVVDENAKEKKAIMVLLVEKKKSERWMQDRL